MPKKIITSRTLPTVLDELDCWTGKLTWDLFCQHLAGVLKVKSISRHTLLSYPELVDAFKQKKNAIKESKSSESLPADMTLESALRRIDELEAKSSRLEAENDRLKEQFVRWQYNLYMMPGVDMDRLNQQVDKPLAKVDRRG